MAGIFFEKNLGPEQFSDSKFRGCQADSVTIMSNEGIRLTAKGCSNLESVIQKERKKPPSVKLDKFLSDKQNIFRSRKNKVTCVATTAHIFI